MAEGTVIFVVNDLKTVSPFAKHQERRSCSISGFLTNRWNPFQTSHLGVIQLPSSLRSVGFCQALPGAQATEWAGAIPSQGTKAS